MKQGKQTEVNDLLAELEDDEETEKAKKAIAPENYSGEEEFVKSLYAFVQKQLEAVQKQESFRSVVVEALIDKIKERDISTAELLKAYEIISKHSRESGSAILNLFKNDGGKGGGGANVFSDAGGGASSGENEGSLEELSSKERNAIDKLARVLSSSEWEDADTTT